MHGRRDYTIGSDGPATTTILTLELPYELNLRLRRTMRRNGRRSLSEVTLEALEAWLENEEAEGGGTQEPP